MNTKCFILPALVACASAASGSTPTVGGPALEMYQRGERVHQWVLEWSSSKPIGPLTEQSLQHAHSVAEFYTYVDDIADTLPPPHVATCVAKKDPWLVIYTAVSSYTMAHPDQWDGPASTLVANALRPLCARA